MWKMALAINWRMCDCEGVWMCVCVCVFLTGMFIGVCKSIDHFSEDADYEQDAAEYLLREYLQMLDIQLQVKHMQ